jgi:hypothetical protein
MSKENPFAIECLATMPEEQKEIWKKDKLDFVALFEPTLQTEDCADLRHMYVLLQERMQRAVVELRRNKLPMAVAVMTGDVDSHKRRFDVAAAKAAMSKVLPDDVFTIVQGEATTCVIFMIMLGTFKPVPATDSTKNE